MNPGFTIASIQVVTAFEPDAGIVLTCGPAIRTLERKLNGSLILLNAPEGAAPHLPRAMLETQDTVLQIALERFQILIRPPTHILTDISLVLDFVASRVGALFGELANVMPKYSWSGVVMDIEYSRQSTGVTQLTEVSGPIFKRLVAIDSKGRDISALNLQFGFKDDGHFVNYAVSAYESRRVDVKLAKPGIHKFKRKECPLVDIGVALNIDINNQPQEDVEGRDPLADVTEIFSKLKGIVPSLPKELNLEGII